MIAARSSGPIRCVVVGGGGHARVVIDTILLVGNAEIAGILDPDFSRSPLLGVPFIGDDSQLNGLAAEGVTHFVMGMGGAGDNGPRRRLFEQACAAGLTPLTIQHPSAVVSSWATNGPGCQFLPGSILNPGASLGRDVIVNTHAVVEHDCEIADHAHVASGATVASTVRIGTGAHVGAGATVIQGRTVGEWAIVGAGAVVIRDVAPRMVVAGVPARSIRAIGGRE